MIGLGRNGLRIARRGIAAVAQSTPSSASAPVIEESSSKKVQNTRRTSNVTPQIGAEQLRLHKKHAETLHGTKLNSLHEAVEYIEWRGNIYAFTLEKIVSLLGNVSTANLNDRQVSVLLSAFGSACDTCSRARRAQMLDQALQTIHKQNVKLGLQSRNVVIAARLANNTPQDAVAELRDLEEAGIEADETTFAFLAQIYARQGNTKAVADILSHMRESGLRVNESHIEQMVYALARSGNDAQANLVVEKFSSSMNIVRLRCAVASAAVARSLAEGGRGGFEAVDALRAIPTTAKINLIENNKYVLDVLIDLVEAGQLDAFQLLSPYLSLTEDGSTLTISHFNLNLVAKARSVLDEQKPLEALTLYSFAHPKFKNEYFEKELIATLENQLKTIPIEQFDNFLRVVTLAEKKNIINDSNVFLLSHASDSPSFDRIIELVKTNGSLRSILAQHPELKKPVCKSISHKLIASSSPSARASMLADIALILFAPSDQNQLFTILSYYPIVFKLGGSDVLTTLPALKQVSDFYARREFATAVVHQLLREIGSDHLAVDKLVKFLNSPEVDSLNSIRVHSSLWKLLASRRKDTTEEADSIRTKIAARILALDFPSESQRARFNFGAKNLIRFIANEQISDGLAARVVSLLENDSRVGLSKEEISEAQQQLKSQPKKAELFNRLKKSQTMARWRAASVTDLLTEHTHLAENKDTKPAVLATIREMILRRTLEEHADVDTMVSVLEQTAEWRKNINESRLRVAAARLEGSALGKALASGDAVLADRIWLLKTQGLSADILLSYASRLFLAGETNRSGQVCAELRASAQPIKPSTLEKMGRRLKGVDAARLDSLAAYLGKEFNLSAYATRRIVQQAKLEQLEALIQSDQMDAALKMAVAETKSAGRAFGQIPLMTEAIRRNDQKLLGDVHVMVRSAHDARMANVDLAFALIAAGRLEKAKKIVEMQNLTIEDKVFQYFTTLAASAEKTDVLHGLFTLFHDRASSVELNSLLELLTRLYWKQGEVEALHELEKQIDAVSFPLQPKVRRFFDNLKVKSENVELD